MKGTDLLGAVAVFACGTAWQAMDKMVELAARGFKDIAVSDPAGTEWTRGAFERMIDED